MWFGLITKKLTTSSTGEKGCHGIRNAIIHKTRLIIIWGTEQAKDLGGRKYLRAPPPQPLLSLCVIKRERQTQCTWSELHRIFFKVKTCLMSLPSRILRLQNESQNCCQSWPAYVTVHFSCNYSAFPLWQHPSYNRFYKPPHVQDGLNHLHSLLSPGVI